MRNEQDNNIFLYSMSEIETMKRLREAPATHHNYCPFTLDEINRELAQRQKEILRQEEILNKGGNKTCDFGR